jgi:tetratricopeptide (TPR) repeat protein
MHKNTLAFVVIAALGGFIAGFWLANSINRSSALTAPAAPPAANQSTNWSGAATPNDDEELSDSEIAAKIAEADRNPGNFAFQRDLGISLYRYGAFKQRPDLLVDSARVLDRAAALKPDDFEVLVALGNARFDIGFMKKDSPSFEAARQVYKKALAIKPNEPDVTTDLGITYILQDPADYAKAEAELKKVTASNPTHDRSLQFLVRAYLGQKRIPEAKATLAKLSSLKPDNSAIPDLNKLVAAAEESR